MKIEATKKGWKLGKRFYVSSRNLAEAQMETREIFNNLK